MDAKSAAKSEISGEWTLQQLKPLKNKMFVSITCAVKGREIGNEKLIGVLDFQNITYRNVDARGLITGFQFLQ
ncbi:hypothetical protein Godav_013901, partial [Gossypium davidsonii]|nr:hypothetical protein [Gossypium davidsonii]